MALILAKRRFFSQCKALTVAYDVDPASRHYIAVDVTQRRLAFGVSCSKAARDTAATIQKYANHFLAGSHIWKCGLAKNPRLYTSCFRAHTHTLHRTQRRWDICPQPIELTHGSTEPTRTIPSSLPLTLSPPFTFIYHLFVQQVLQHTQRSSQLWRAFPNSIFTTETLSISMLSLSLSYHGCCTVVHIRRQGWTGSSETPPVDSHLPCTTVVFSTPSGNTTTRVRSCSRGLSCCSMGVRW